MDFIYKKINHIISTLIRTRKNIFLIDAALESTFQARHHSVSVEHPVDMSTHTTYLDPIYILVITRPAPNEVIKTKTKLNNYLEADRSPPCLWDIYPKGDDIWTVEKSLDRLRVWYKIRHNGIHILS